MARHRSLRLERHRSVPGAANAGYPCPEPGADASADNTAALAGAQRHAFLGTFPAADAITHSTAVLGPDHRAIAVPVARADATAERNADGGPVAATDRATDSRSIASGE